MSESDEDMEMAANIPFTFVPFDVINHLAMLLDPPIVARRCKDWKGLADKLGYITQEIYSLESRQTPDGSNTKKLLADYVQHHKSNVGQVMDALKELERVDAYQVLDEALPEIRRKKREREMAKRQRMDPQQNSCNFSESFGIGPPQQLVFNSGHVYELSPTHAPSLGMPMHSYMPSDCRGFSHRSISDSGVHANSCDHPLLSNRDRVQRAMSGGSVSFAGNGHSYQPLMPLQKISDSREGTELYNRNGVTGLVDELMDTESAGSLANPFQSPPRKRSIEASDVARTSCSEQPLSTVLYSEERLNSDTSMLSLPSLSQLESNDVTCRSPTEGTFSQWNTLNSVTENSGPIAKDDYSLIPLQHLDTNVSSPCSLPSTLLTSASELTSQNSYQVPSPSVKSDITTGTRTRKHNLLHPCETFPKGAKEKQRSEIPKELRGMREERSLLTQYKSISEPRNVSPAPFGLAKRETRVFLTYASDSTRHLNRVMAAASNLRDNGFRVSCDLYEKEFVNHSEESRDNWLQTRYAGADFILICVSPMYYRQVQLPDDTMSMHSRSMHEAFIYKMMEQEARVQGKYSRFICLLFKDASVEHIPPMLNKHVPVYKWPEQYKDLFFKLIKPEKILTNSRTQPSLTPSEQLSSASTAQDSSVRNPVIVRKEVT